MKTKFTFKSLLIITCLLLQFNMKAQDAQLVILHVERAGTLSGLIEPNDKYQITDLTLTGNLNGTDIKYIREMAGRTGGNGEKTIGKLSKLNLAGANIVSGGDYYYSQYSTSNNSIGKYAFSDCSELTSIVTPNNITSIEDRAFSRCSGLTSIVIHNNITSIGEEAFLACSGLTSIVIPNSVISIGGWAFSRCIGLTSVLIEDDASASISIGVSAFSGCTGLTSIMIPGSVTSIKNGAFGECTRLTEIVVSEQNLMYSSLDGVLFNKARTSLIRYPPAKSVSSYVIPNSVISIEGDVFSNCANLTSITIPNSVTSIGPAFFRCTGLKSITIPDGITYIDHSTFEGCTSLTSVTIPNSVTMIGMLAFGGCTSLTEIRIKNPVPPSAAVAFVDVNKKTCKIYVPKGSATAYLLAWHEFENIIEEDEASINTPAQSNIKQYIDNGYLHLTDVKTGASIQLFDINGTQLIQIIASSSEEQIKLPQRGTYILKVQTGNQMINNKIVW